MDIFYKKSKTYIMAVLLAVCGCVTMVCFPGITVLSSQKAVALWIGSVMPSLLPFFILSNFLSQTGITEKLPKPAYVWLMGAMSGYPTGAKTIGDMYRRGDIDEREAKYFLSFCCITGPAFLVGTLGCTMLNSAEAGAVIAAAHYLGSLLNGLFFYWIKKLYAQKLNAAHIAYRKKWETRNFGKADLRPKNEKKIGKHAKSDSIAMRNFKNVQKVVRPGILEMFTDAILSALKSMGIILAYMILFMFATDVLQFIGFMNIFEIPLLKGIAKGVLEMTVGCAGAAGATEAGLFAQTIAITLIATFGGLSVAGQSMSMLSGTGISLFYYLKVKICHSLWAGIIAFTVLYAIQ